MGDERHKKPPTKDEMEPVTRLFVLQVKAALAKNLEHNERGNIKPGDRGYRIATHADLSAASGVDPNQIKNMLGGMRPGTKTKKIGRSRDVPKIRRALDLPRMISVEVPADRAEVLQLLASLSPDAFLEVERELLELARSGDRG